MKLIKLFQEQIASAPLSMSVTELWYFIEDKSSDGSIVDLELKRISIEDVDELLEYEYVRHTSKTPVFKVRKYD